MKDEHQPLYTLTIGEFKVLTKELIEKTLQDQQKKKEQTDQNSKVVGEHFSIKELASFLNCSKVSIHNYKKRGLPFYRMGRTVLFRKQEVFEFMNTLKVNK
jgi:excisionase family DNA binding protein